MTSTEARVVAVIAYAGLIGSCFAVLGGVSGPLLPALLFLVLATPSGVFGTYLMTLRRIHRLGMWAPDSFAVRWLSGPWLALAVGVLTAFLTAAALSLRLSVADWIDLTLLAVCVAILGLILHVRGNWLRSQFQPLYGPGKSLFWAAVGSAGLMSLLDPVARIAVGAYGAHGTLREAIEAARRQATWLGDSAVSNFTSGWGSVWSGLEQFLLGRLAEDSGPLTWLALFVAGLSRFPLYFAAGLTVCAFLLPQIEYKRILLNSSSDGEVSIIPARRIALVSASITILLFFVYIPIVAIFETAIGNRPAARSPEATIIRSVEVIGDHYHSAGTMEEVRRLAIVMMDDRREALGPVESALNDGFSMMRENVDSYLDWYYSLPGEWTRVANLLTGNIESHLARKLSEELGAGQPFAEFERAVEAAFLGEARRRDEFRQRAIELIAARRVEVAPEEEVEVLVRAEQEDLLSLPTHSGLTTLEQRLGVTVATSGVSGVVAATAARQVLVKVAARGTIRTAATAIVRLTGVRAASGGGGAAAGAAAGAVVGSVVPGIGTVVGAAVGGVVGGLSVGVAAEFLILKLEELWSREGHRQELLAAISDAEAEMRRQFGLDTTEEIPR